jgi:endonuclease YncB( thermonuclease family)
VAGRKVRVVYKQKDRYGRILGTVYVGNRNVNEAMVREGLAWRYRYSRDRHLAALQAEAKAKKRNIWSEKHPVDPYDFRKQRKK